MAEKSAFRRMVAGVAPVCAFMVVGLVIWLLMPSRAWVESSTSREVSSAKSKMRQLAEALVSSYRTENPGPLPPKLLSDPFTKEELRILRDSGGFRWIIISAGPDKIVNYGKEEILLDYDSTNGTRSAGDVISRVE